MEHVIGGMVCVLLSILIFQIITQKEVKQMKAAITALTAAVNNLTGAVQAAVAGGITDPAQIQAVNDAVTAINAAVTALQNATVPAGQ